MRSPSEMAVIQIEITNACVHQCSNCTRFCGHHRKNFFMDRETFMRAVNSLAEFPNTVGMMGGEPTLHPDFAELATYFKEHFGSRETMKRGRLPIPDFSKYIADEFRFPGPKERGLWTIGGKHYYRNFELIQDTFNTQVINDHQYDSLHQGILLARKDLGVPDDKWEKIRDACWLQNMWSASITPKGAFFCEIAAALDMLFDGPGGWPIEPGWWKRTPEAFGDQLNWCEFCGIALKGPTSLASEATDDVTISILERLEKLESPKVARKKYRLFHAESFGGEGSTFVHYVPEGGKRVEINTLKLYPRKIDALTYPSPSGDHAFLGETLSSFIEDRTETDWILLHPTSVELSSEIEGLLKKIVFNPGCLYLYHVTAGKAPTLASVRFGEVNMATPLFVLLNPLAHSFTDIDLMQIRDFDELVSAWQSEKVISITDATLML